MRHANTASALLLLAGAALYLLYHSLDRRLPDFRAAHFTDSAFQPTMINGEQFPKTLIDASGAEHLLKQPPHRIVSLTLGTDEMLHELVDHRRIVGITFLADNNRTANIADKFSPHIARLHAQIEPVLALEPDLVFVASYTQAETVRLLFGAGIAVVRLMQPNSFAELEQNIRLVSQVTGREQQARSLLEKRHQYLNEIQARVDNLTAPRVLFYSLSGDTEGPGTVVDEMISLAGGYNAIRDTGIRGTQKISPEMAMGLEPDVILMSGGPTPDNASAAQTLLNNPVWQQVPAVQNQRVYNVNVAWVFSVSQYSWQGVGQIARFLHPGAFKP